MSFDLLNKYGENSGRVPTTIKVKGDDGSSTTIKCDKGIAFVECDVRTLASLASVGCAANVTKKTSDAVSVSRKDSVSGAKAVRFVHALHGIDIRSLPSDAECAAIVGEGMELLRASLIGAAAPVVSDPVPEPVVSGNGSPKKKNGSA